RPLVSFPGGKSESVLSPPQVRDVLSRVFDEVVEVNLMDSEDYIHLAFLKRPELGVTLTKLHCWTLTHYSKCVFLDADTLVLHNIDELFDREELSAAPDPGWPDCFNSGVFVFRPSLETHQLLLQHATEHGSFDGADQGLLNSFFRDWPTADIHKHLPFIYNLTSNAAYTYSPAFQQFGSSAKVVHFLGSTKPWNCTYDPQTGSVSEQGAGPGPRQHVTFLNLWWRLFQEGARPLYPTTHAQETQGPAGLRVSGRSSASSAEDQPVPAKTHSSPGFSPLCVNTQMLRIRGCSVSAVPFQPRMQNTSSNSCVCTEPVHRPIFPRVLTPQNNRTGIYTPSPALFCI
uniref:glycogenin glucosyltransferase n=1 Tax=Spermophilus dauricus TaxID=99837 RepID=A0A8C9PL30_SPEDA